MPGDDGFSASELRKRNLRGGTVADDELSCASAQQPSHAIRASAAAARN